MHPKCILFFFGAEFHLTLAHKILTQHTSQIQIKEITTLPRLFSLISRFPWYKFKNQALLRRQTSNVELVAQKMTQ